MQLDLENLSLSELKSLQKKVAKAIDGFEQRKRDDAIAAAQKAVADFGFKLDDLMGGSKKTPKGKGLPKYANPKDASQTWTGKGRRPSWVIAHLDAGGSLEEISI